MHPDSSLRRQAQPHVRESDVVISEWPAHVIPDVRAPIIVLSSIEYLLNHLQSYMQLAAP